MSAVDIVELAARRAVGFLVYVVVALVAISIPLLAFESPVSQAAGLLMAIYVARWIGRRLVGLD
ncbi:hypothetical protein [Haloarcula nitratireducens]|uniref:Uncharacterized protein n=1 Tax=Haloarcula nitratireducens TaxID=2487749 RepID=A0AAW4PGV9_9EURY|nr:hypothetical protein [Halomicroarcula nitratireducens]MBX0296756.1 hypothetical protein [Halomicroarcula nitratireducens]